MQPLTLAAWALALAAADPFPLSPGTWWEYRESYAESLSGLVSISDEVTRFEVRGSLADPFIHQRGGVDPTSGPVERGDDWIRLLPWTGEEPLPLPLDPGRSGPPAAEATAGWSVEAEEQVVVPAGSFATLRCALRTRSAVSILWIAPAVGVVRETHGPPGSRPEIERVLLRWSGATAGKRAPPAPKRQR